MEHHISDRRYELTKNNRLIPMVMMAIGVIAIVVGFMKDPTRTWASLLHNNFYFTALSLSAVFFIAVNYLAQSGWSVAVKRVSEAMAGFLKYGAAGMILIFFLGHNELYSWTRSEAQLDPILAGKHGFLNLPFFIVRMFAYFIIW